MADAEVISTPPPSQNILHPDTQILSLSDIPEDLSPSVPQTPQFDERPPQSADGYADDAASSEEDQELSPNGILDEDTVAHGLSQLGRSACGADQVFLHLTLPGYNLVDIEILQSYNHLQKVEIPYNHIADLRPLSYMPYLIELDASHNDIAELLDFEPPFNLKEVDLSYNKIEEMTDLSPHHALTKLILDNNNISEIKGLSQCCRLNHLSLAHNSLRQISNLENLPLKFLNLRGNEIEIIENIETLSKLQYLNISGNSIRSMSGLQDHDVLEVIDLEDNQIHDITEVKYIRDLLLLRDLNLLRNPIQELDEYRISLLYRLQQLTQLDRRRVEVDEKVMAVNSFNPPMKVVAARNHIKQVVSSLLQPATIYDSTLPSIETPYPMLVLVGPSGSNKRELSHRLVEDFPDYFGYGIMHCTRTAYSGELDGRDYNFVTPGQFQNMEMNGKFILTYENSGSHYGLSMDAIENIAKDGLACVVHLEIEGVMVLKHTYFEPRYVLILPLDKNIHSQRLHERGHYTVPQVEQIIHRNDLYKEINQQHPGFFDMTIDSNNGAEAYRRLKKLVMDYLGISGTAGFTLTDDPSSDTQTTTTTGNTLQSNGGSGTSGSATGVKTWSKQTVDTASQQMTQAIRNKLEPTKSAVEQASYERRLSAAKAAAAGVVPRPIDQLLSKPPGTAPTQGGSSGDLEGLSGSGKERPLTVAVGSGIFNEMNAAAQTPDSSEATTRSSSHLSNISEARGFSNPVSPDEARSQMGSQSSFRLPGTEMAQEPEFIPRPPSQGSNGSRPGSVQSLGRPGSNTKPVLPPIATSPRENVRSLPEY
ncbi:leucine-rich repeat and guanylate kinase domain-containing protein-like [Ptychodera flava]|uniref:leucine-rich repeat and guanylate kinase domain-containing protein-like n=1 Tax=Ptychodera flava TaxID=63121 RepID=UPI003969C8AD